MSLEETVELLKTDADFALFFAPLICRSNGGNQTAAACVEAFYKPQNKELEALCIPEGEYGTLQKCTDQNLLLSPIAFRITGGQGFGGKKR